jgi:hypothetical protein
MFALTKDWINSVNRFGFLALVWLFLILDFISRSSPENLIKDPSLIRAV